MIRCPWCGRDYEPVGEGRCPQCGALPPPGLGSTAPPGAGEPPGEAGEGQGLAWERRAEVGRFRGLFATVRAVLFSPGRAFRAMSRTAPLGDPMVFALVLGTLGFAFSGLLQVLSFYAMADPFERMAETMPGPAQEAYLQLANLARNWRVNLVIQLAQAPFLALLLPALAAIGAHVFLLILGGNSAGLNGTLRVMLYSTGSTAVLCFVPVPCCDSILALVWYFVAATVGLNAVHRTGTGKAVAAVLGPPALACCCYCGVSLLYGMAAGLLRAGIPTP